MTSKKIGRYEIRSELGRGGMATVYRAYDPSFDREVAIKVLPREFMHDPQFRDRFQREVKTIALLEHPAIVPVYDVGEDDGMPYFVMRYMPGGSLSDWIEKGRFTLQDTARLIERLAQALGYAHKKGVIHRDLKPDNILFDSNGNPFISDFGVAKFSEAATNLTGSGIIGTPAYMSPEQAQGEDVDGRSDVYGLGVIVYQMLSGRQPYSADTPMGVVVKHITEPVPEILKVTPDLPIEADLVIKTAMAKNRSKRFATTSDLARALNKAAFGAEGSPTSSTLSRMRGTLAGSSGGRTGAVIGGVVILIALVGVFLLRNQLFVPAVTATPVPSLTPLPTTEPTQEPSPVVIQPTSEVVSLPTEVEVAPVCPADVIPPISKPTVRETNKDCIVKLPFTTLSIPKDATYESQRDGFTCSKTGTNGNRVLIACTGKELFSFDVKVCNPQTVPTPVSEADAARCEQDSNYDSANQCCMPVPEPDAACTIFQVDLRGCSN